MGRSLTQDEVAMSVVERRVSVRARILAEELQRAEVRAADTGSTERCRTRRAVYGAHHEPCEPPADDQLGLVCLCPCHDAALAGGKAEHATLGS